MVPARADAESVNEPANASAAASFKTLRNICPPVSDVLERHGFGKARIAQRHQGPAARHPAQGGEEKSADGEQSCHVRDLQMRPFPMHRDNTPVEVHEVHEE